MTSTDQDLDRLGPAQGVTDDECLQGMKPALFGARDVERLDLDRLANGTAANALDAHTHRLILAVGHRHVDLLQVRNEFSPGDPGDFGSDPTEVLRLTTGLNAVAHLHFFAARFALSCHQISRRIGYFCRFSVFWARQYTWAAAGREAGITVGGEPRLGKVFRLVPLKVTNLAQVSRLKRRLTEHPA